MSAPSISYPHHYHQLHQSKQQEHNSRCAYSSQSTTNLRPAKMASTTTCYAYELPATPQRQTTTQPAAVQVPPSSHSSNNTSNNSSNNNNTKDYSRPLHVDCSVEYELPNTAKPPQGVRNEPLLMIHPCYFRKIESQRRSPFINNLPQMRPAKKQQRPTTTTRVPQVPPQQQTQQQYHQPPNTVQQQQQQQQQNQYDRHQQRHLHHQLWDASMPPQLVPITAAAAAQPYQPKQQHQLRQDAAAAAAAAAAAFIAEATWGGVPDRSPNRPEDNFNHQLLHHKQQQQQHNQHILSGKYRQYLRAHRLHPYVASTATATGVVAAGGGGIPFPQIQQVCYNV